MSSHRTPRSTTATNTHHPITPSIGVTTRGQEKRAAAAAEEQRRSRADRSSRLIPTDRTMPTFVVLGGRMLELENPTIAAALSYWHRYARYIDVHHPPALAGIDPHIVAAAALSLAAKQCEDPVKLRDVVNVCFWLVKTDENENPYLDISDRYFDLKDSLIDAELVLIRVLDFDVAIDSPFPYVVAILEDARKNALGQAPWATKKSGTGAGDGRGPRSRPSSSSHTINNNNSRDRFAPPPALPPPPPTPPPYRTLATLTTALTLDAHLSPLLALTTNPRHLAVACTNLAGRACGVDVQIARAWELTRNGNDRSERASEGSEELNDVLADVVAFMKAWEEDESR